MSLLKSVGDREIPNYTRFCVYSRPPRRGCTITAINNATIVRKYTTLFFVTRFWVPLRERSLIIHQFNLRNYFDRWGVYILLVSVHLHHRFIMKTSRPYLYPKCRGLFRTTGLITKPIFDPVRGSAAGKSSDGKFLVCKAISQVSPSA